MKYYSHDNQGREVGSPKWEKLCKHPIGSLKWMQWARDFLHASASHARQVLADEYHPDYRKVKKEPQLPPWLGSEPRK